MVVFLCAATTSGVAFISFGFGAIYPFIQEDLQISRAQVGLIASTFFVGGAGTVLLAGWLFDRFGVRRLQSGSLLGVVVALVLFSQIQSLVQGLILAVIIGIALAATFPGYMKAIVDWVPPRNRSLSIGIIEANITAAGIMSALLLTYVAVTYSWRSSVVVLAALLAVASIVFFSFYRDKPQEQDSGQRRGQGPGRMSTVLRDRDMWLVGFNGIAATSIQGVPVSYMVLFLKEEIDVSTGAAGAALAVLMAGGSIGRLMWGIVGDMLLRERRASILALVMTLSAVFTGLITLLPSGAPYFLVLVVVFFLGATSLGVSGLWSVLVAELGGPALAGTAAGFANTIQRVGAFALPPLFGLIVDKTGSYDPAWWMMIGVSAVGVLLLVPIRRAS